MQEVRHVAAVSAAQEVLWVALDVDLDRGASAERQRQQRRDPVVERGWWPSRKTPLASRR
jgi:hypothetical protein